MTRRRLVLAAVIGTAVAIVIWVLGVVAADAVLVGLVVAVTCTVPLVIGQPPPVHWPAPPEREGAPGWSGVHRLASALGRSSGDALFGRVVEPRLITLIDERILEAGPALDDPRVRDLYHQVERARSARQVSSEVERILDRLDELTNEEGTR